MAEIWTVRVRPYNSEWEGSLIAYWEVLLDPISDNYTPEEISADELFDLWVEKIQGECPNNLVPIYWFAESAASGKFESMPFQLHNDDEDFLTNYSWPVNARTREPLNWLNIPVMDKLWNSSRADKGGFIQEATGWKPSILQPYVYLPSLVNGRHP